MSEKKMKNMWVIFTKKCNTEFQFAPFCSVIQKGYEMWAFMHGLDKEENVSKNIAAELAWNLRDVVLSELYIVKNSSTCFGLGQIQKFMNHLKILYDYDIFPIYFGWHGWIPTG